MATPTPTTSGIPCRVRARALGESILAIATLAVMVGAVVTLARPETLFGSAPIVVEASR